MRDIKVRAYMPKENKWYSGGAVQLIAMIGKSYGLSEPNAKIIELQEFTGLHDKNGTEIYEGDIITHGRHLNKIFWNKNTPSFMMRNIDKGLDAKDVFLVKSYCSGIEVVGNIYENPELGKS